MKEQSKLIKLQITECEIDENTSVVIEDTETYIELLSFTLAPDRLFIRGSDMPILKKITNELQQTRIAQLTAQVALLTSRLTPREV